MNNTALSESYNDDLVYNLSLASESIMSSLQRPKTAENTEGSRAFVHQDKESSVVEKELGWWLGKVTEIHDDHFVALLEDNNQQESTAEFEMALLDSYNKNKLTIGSRFTYSISILDAPTGRRYSIKLSLSAKRQWLENYRDDFDQYAEKLFPERLINL
ncbi:MAG: hypothetical protein ACYDHW_08160 [Syntrophorhabdaceae bacterium]